VLLTPVSEVDKVRALVRVTQLAEASIPRPLLPYTIYRLYTISPCLSHQYIDEAVP